VSSILLAFGLTTFAGLATGVGSVIAFTAKRTNYRFLSVAMGFSAGVMLYVSFVEIFFKGATALTEIYGDRWGEWINVAAFFGGVLLIGLIDNLIPSAENPHEVYSEAEIASLHDQATPLPDSVATDGAGDGTPLTQAHSYHSANRKLMRMGIFTALAIGIHNFPEGVATFLAVLEDPTLGLAITVAVALHNIPEGISVSVPIFYATGNRRKAFVYSVASGLAEPVGAGIAYLLLRIFFTGDEGVFPPQVMGIIFGAVAGIMVYISLDELLPTSRAYGRGHDSLFGLVAGMAVMALSLLLLK
jgi:ZIP family zinc transporter